MKISLKKNFIWTLLGNVVFAICQWGILISIARLSDAKSVGLFTLGLAITAPVLVFSNMNLRAVQATDSKNEFTLSDYFTLRLITSSTAFALLLCIIFLLNYSSETQLVIVAVGLVKLIETFSDIIYGFFQKNEQMHRIAISMIIRGLLGLISLSVILYIFNSMLFAILIMAIAWLINFIIFDLPNAWLIRNTYKSSNNISITSFFLSKSVRNQKRLFLISFPLAVVMVITVLNTTIPRYTIEYFHGSTELGIFSVMAYFIVIGNTIILALGQSAIPRLAYYFSANQLEQFYSIIKKLIFTSLALGITGIIIASFFGQKILLLFYGGEFAQYPLVFIILMVVAAITYVGDLLGVALTAMRRFRIAIPIHICSMFMILIGALFFIQPFGLVGAAYSMLLSSCLSTILFFIAVFYTDFFDKCTFRIS